MILYVKKGNLKYKPEDIGMPFNIYDMGTYHIAIEDGSIADNILNGMGAVSKNIDTSGVKKYVIESLEDIGILDEASGITEGSAFFALSQRLSFGPKEKTDSDIYKYIEKRWNDQFYQSAFPTIKEIAAGTHEQKEQTRQNVIKLLKNGNLVAYDMKPRYPKELYNDVDTMPFIVYTENNEDMQDVLLKVFKGKESKYVN